jgi:predicted nucleic acid-binding protein
LTETRFTTATSVFVDSTTLIYFADRNAPAKRARASEWLKSLARSKTLLLSPQVLNEVYWVLHRKQHLRTTKTRARALVRLFAPFAVAPLAPSLVPQAWRIEDRYGLSYYDALLLASANVAGCAYFLSEDLNDGQRYGSVQAINPFRHAPDDVLGRALRN